LKGGLDGIGRDLLNQAGGAMMGAAKEFIGNAIQEMLVTKKTSDTKRVLPSIQKMKIVSFPTLNRRRRVNECVCGSCYVSHQQTLNITMTFKVTEEVFSSSLLI
jgi:hypothetical protein